MKFSYEVTGTAANEEPWAVIGQIDSESYAEAINLAYKDAFERLTKGKAIFGRPGVGGCKGPYKIINVALEEI